MTTTERLAHYQRLALDAVADAAAPVSPPRMTCTATATFKHSDEHGELFVGHAGRECGEHRTVGSYRAWCFDCGEWCYPSAGRGCMGCRVPAVEAELHAAEAKLAAIRTLVNDPGGPDTWSFTFEGEHGIFANDVRAILDA